MLRCLVLFSKHTKSSNIKALHCCGDCRSCRGVLRRQSVAASGCQRTALCQDSMLHGMAVCRQRGRSSAASGGLGGAAGAGESELQLQRRRLATRRRALLAKLGEVGCLGCCGWLHLVVQVQCNQTHSKSTACRFLAGTAAAVLA